MNTPPQQKAAASPALKSILELRDRLDAAVVGQQALVERILIALLTGGHLLVEGAPGLAKTRAINTLAQHIEGEFARIQFTPDLLPADLTGTEIYRPQEGSFKFQPGPLFHNLILADEINRAPAKVQSALLEAMGELQITVGQQSYRLPEIFLVMATQNPIEQEGTYPLPEAQLDRFLMHVTVDYPHPSTEREILRLVRQESQSRSASLQREPVDFRTLIAGRSEVLDQYMADPVEDYLIRLVTTTRNPESLDQDLARWIEFGGSPRATIALDCCARAHAWLSQRQYVSPADVQAVAHDVLRHRLLLSYEAEADGVRPDHVVDRLLALVPVP
ncbi:MAG: MoxR family ATPase [Pseudomonadota bacterium]